MTAGEQVDGDPYGLAVADVISRLRRAMRRAARADGRDGLPGGLSVAQLEFLSCLAENPGARPGQVARMLRLAPSSVATLVNGLAREQLIHRSDGVPDRRTAVLSLTVGGAGVVASWQQVNARILTVALATLDLASQETLALALPALSKLTGAVDALADETPLAHHDDPMAHHDDPPDRHDDPPDSKNVPPARDNDIMPVRNNDGEPVRN